jgi:glutamate-5-semialdehyde dehydrogenase
MTTPESQLPKALQDTLSGLRRASRTLRQMPSANKNQILEQLAKSLVQNEEPLLQANAKDVARLQADVTPAFRDRLTLNSQRIAAMAESLKQVAQLPDPVGEVVESKRLVNGLQIRRVRAPLGVLFLIFESRPNVILEAFSLAFKSGNAILLRGGSDSRETALVIYRLMSEVLSQSEFADSPYYGMNDYDRGLVLQLLACKSSIDVVIPRGGDRLIELVQKNASMPIIKNDRGMCHAFIDADADLAMGVRIVTNAKTQRPGVCNSLETVLVHRNVSHEFLPRLFTATETHALEFHADATAITLLGGPSSRVRLAEAQDWDTEYLDLKLNCRIVDSVEEAMEHIEKHGSRHSETIITRNANLAHRFQEEVDAAAVYWNASTRFTDGFEFGLGGELGISTQKLHVRGPVGLRELTTPRWLIDGTGQIRE